VRKEGPSSLLDRAPMEPMQASLHEPTPCSAPRSFSGQPVCVEQPAPASTTALGHVPVQQQPAQSLVGAPTAERVSKCTAGGALARTPLPVKHR
jgi:hypothetical protein